jgi:hypothetical protein
MWKRRSAITYSDTAYSPATDLDGTPRPPGAEDAGAYERRQALPSPGSALRSRPPRYPGSCDSILAARSRLEPEIVSAS